MAQKQKIVILQSTDGCGKTTIKKLLEKRSNYEYIVLDRFTDSIIYDKLYKRKNRDKVLFKLEAGLNRIADVYLIYLDCKIERQLERLELKNEEKQIVDTIERAKELYEDYLEKTCLRYTIVDTTNITPEEAVEEIIKFVVFKRR